MSFNKSFGFRISAMDVYQHGILRVLPEDELALLIGGYCLCSYEEPVVFCPYCQYAYLYVNPSPDSPHLQMYLDPNRLLDEQIKKSFALDDFHAIWEDLTKNELHVVIFGERDEDGDMQMTSYELCHDLDEATERVPKKGMFAIWSFCDLVRLWCEYNNFDKIPGNLDPEDIILSMGHYLLG